MVDDNYLLDGRYRIKKMIKTGGFGAVYYGWDLDLDRPVAIKVIHQNLFSEAKFVDMFQDEAINTAKLNHPNIVHIYSLRRSKDGRFFIIMEYIEGVDTRSLITKCKSVGKKLPPELCAFILKEVAKALQYAHTRTDIQTKQPLRIIHRDISPSNIMVSVDGDVKLIDFGIAKAKTRRSERTRVGELKGKIGYMSPEQAQGREEIDHRSDLFSAGLLLFELLTSERLYANESEMGLLRDVSHARISRDRIEELVADPYLIRIIQKSLKKDIDERYQSGMELDEDLDTYLRKFDIVNYRSHLSQFFKSVYFADEIITVEKVEESISQDNEGFEEQFLKTTKIAGDSDLAKIRAKYSDDEPEKEHADSKTTVIPVSREEKTDPKKDVTPQILSAASDDDRSGTEEPKTIIDMIRLSARDYKNRIIKAGLILILGFLVFLVFDTMNQWTSLGRTIYDILFPPTLYLQTIPSGALVTFNNMPCEGKERVRIPKVKPGAYIIKCSLPGYQDITRTINVQSKGATVGGKVIEQNYTLAFSVPVTIKSIPSEATVTINGMKSSNETPYQIDWEVTQPLELKLEKEGFRPLTGCQVDLKTEEENIEDIRVWEFIKSDGDNKSYTLVGTFSKEITIESNPVGANVFLDQQERACAVTGPHSKVNISVGAHQITLKKKNYIDDRFILTVNENTEDVIQRPLYRYVQIVAYADRGEESKPINAELVRMGRPGRWNQMNGTMTPTSCRFGPWTYQLQISAGDGFRDTTVVVRPDEWRKEIYVQRELPVLAIFVKASDTDNPILNTVLTIEMIRTMGGFIVEDSKRSTHHLGQNGEFESKFQSGIYRLSVSADGYHHFITEITFDMNWVNPFEIRLDPNDTR